MQVVIHKIDGTDFGPVEAEPRGMDEDGLVEYLVVVPFQPWLVESVEIDIFPAKSGLVFEFQPIITLDELPSPGDDICARAFKEEGVVSPKKKRWWQR